jgi:hypothetical protein
MPDHPCAPGAQAEPQKIENGVCATNADCVLTDLPAQCNACNLPQVYVTRRRALDERNALCTPGSCAPCCDAMNCPPHDHYIPAFYRAECREHRCIAWRYHSGG